MSNTMVPAYEVIGTLTREQAVAVAELLAGGSVLWDRGHTFPCDGIEIRPARPTPETSPDPDEETPCPKRDDGIHCECWYGGNPCCGCGREDILDGREKAPCPTANRGVKP